MTTEYPYGYPYLPPPSPPPPPPPPPAAAPRRRGLLVTGIATIAAAAVLGGMSVAQGLSGTVGGSGSLAVGSPSAPGGGNVLIPGNMNRNGAGNGTPTSVGLATAAQQKGIVTIVSVLKYQNAESAGTGMVLTPDGEILTNNHVINGATSTTVTVAATGRSYRADVVGTDPSDDVAVLQLRKASGLATANLGDSSQAAVGDAIVGVGNAGGTGTLRASSGKVTALNQSITATDETGQDGEKLTGLIEVAAAIISGDSGGPLYDSAGEIIGMNTAASADRRAASTAYAIPIDDAVKIAGQIETGIQTAKIHIGLPAFLGVGVGQGGTQGAAVTTLLDGGPAASAGITAGSVITAVGSTRVASADALKSALRPYRPGQQATISWTGADGSSHSATVTLGTGPAD